MTLISRSPRHSILLNLSGFGCTGAFQIAHTKEMEVG
jgi:hypothetical protein